MPFKSNHLPHLQDFDHHYECFGHFRDFTTVTSGPKTLAQRKLQTQPKLEVTRKVGPVAKSPVLYIFPVETE